MDSAESEPKQGKFEGWAIVEMMGHQREAGYVTTEVYGIAVLFRVDVPEMPEQEEVLTRPEWSGREYLEVGSKVKRQKVPARSRLIAPAALYAINPATEQAVRECLAAKIERTLILLQAPERPALPAKAEAEAEPGANDQDDICDNCGGVLEETLDPKVLRCSSCSITVPVDSATDVL